MFFYVSFLRPPPDQSVPFGNILITPQIANDLRTEPFDGTEDIFYSWSHSTSSSNQLAATKPAKLTTWRKATAYKEIPVPLPPGVRDGQAWRLLLSTRPSPSLDALSTIDLCSKDVGRLAFPAMSMPIQFRQGVSKKSQKQEQIERMYRLRPRTEDDAGVVLRLMEQTSFDLDKKVWDSGIGLSSWLVELEQFTEPEGALAELKNVLFSVESRNILELGAGIGIVGLCLAALRSTGSQPPDGVKDRIIATDLESAMPLIEKNIAANATHLQNTRLEAAVLDWDYNTVPDSYAHDLPDGFDAIIMADVTYNTASFPSLVRTLSRLVRLGSKPPLVLLGYKEREVAERTLWDLVGEIGLKFRKIGERVGAGGAPVEVWLGKIDSQ